MTGTVTREWQQWIEDNLRRGCKVEDMVGSMVAGGHALGTARETITTTGNRIDPQWANRFVAPGPITFNGHDCTLLMTLGAPNMALIDGFLTREECQTDHGSVGAQIGTLARGQQCRRFLSAR